MDKAKGGRAFYSTVKGFIDAGWNVWFVSSGGSIPSGLLNQNQTYEKEFKLIDKSYRTSKIKVIYRLSKLLRVLLTFRFLYKTGKAILKRNNNGEFILYAYEVDAVLAARKLSIIYNAPLVTRFQGTVHYLTNDTLFNRCWFMPHLSALKTCADLTIMTNDGTKGLQTLVKLGNKSKKVLFWRNGVDQVPSPILLNRDNIRKQLGICDNIVFLTVSRLGGWKRVDRAITAFAEVYKEYPSISLFIVGDGDKKHDLEHLARALGVDHAVNFTGSVSQEDIYNYMIAADVFLSFYDLSNVGNPLMEAMRCGKPIITLDNGDTKEIITNGENGILISESEISRIPREMKRLIEDKEYSLKIAIGAKAYANREFWTWDERIDSEIKEIEALRQQHYRIS